MGRPKKKEADKVIGRFVGNMNLSVTPLLYTMISYYSWKFSRSRATMLRAFIAAMKNHPTFDPKEFTKFAKERMRPQFEVVGKEYAAMLDRDLKVLLESDFTAETVPFYDVLRPDDD